jgi:Ca2+-binding EF-hand superfamily protein
MTKKNVNILHNIFIKFDVKKSGVLAVDDFKTCFLQADFNFTMEEITRLTRYLDKEKDDKINYAYFLKLVDDVFFDKHNLDDLTKFNK